MEHYTTFDIMSGHNDRWPSRIPTFTDKEPTLREKYLIIELKKMMIRYAYLNKGERPSDISEGISPFFENEWPSSIPTFKDEYPSQREIHLRGEINDIYNINQSLTLKELEMKSRHS